MKRTKTQLIGDLLSEFYKENPELQEKILEVRVLRAWGEVLGASVSQATRSLYVRDHVLYVSVNSSVLRNELMLSRSRLIECINQHVGSSVIRNIVLR